MKRIGCIHKWDPWPFVLPFRILGFVFPGARCRLCNTEEVCGTNKVSAERAFYNRFWIHFSMFMENEETRALVRKLEAEKGLRASRIAQEWDYLQLNRDSTP